MNTNPYKPAHEAGHATIDGKQHKLVNGIVFCNPELKCKACYPVVDLTFKFLPKQETLF